MRVASSPAQSKFDKSASRQVRLAASELPSLVPSGASLKLKSVKVAELQMGDLICVRMGTRFAVRRFLKLNESGTLLLTAREGFDEKEAMPKTSLLGQVESAHLGSKTYEPAKTENPLKAWWSRLTEYGTRKPFR